jgi:hypothetical protein
MERTHTFANNWIVLNVGGVRFETSLQTLTSVPHTFLDSMFSGRYPLLANAEGACCIDRDGTHFRHIVNFLRDPVSFTLSPDLTEAQSAELAVEVQFYGLLRLMMPTAVPYYAQEQIGEALLRRACVAGTDHALRAAVAQARELVVEMGSTTPWLTEEFQDARYVITDDMVNDMLVWAAESGDSFMYRSTRWWQDGDRQRNTWYGGHSVCLDAEHRAEPRVSRTHPAALGQMAES